MRDINEELVDYELDLGANRKGEVNESYLAALGYSIKFALQRMFNPMPGPKLKVRGTAKEIDSFFSALKSEKRFMDAYTKHGLNDPKTIKNASALKRSVSRFEGTTGLRWPFK